MSSHPLSRLLAPRSVALVGGAWCDAVAASGDATVGVLDGGHHAGEPSRDDRVRAGWRDAVMAARFETDVERRATRPLAGVANGLGFRVGAAAGLGRAATHDHAVAHDDAANGRVGRRHAKAAPPVSHRRRHEESA